MQAELTKTLNFKHAGDLYRCFSEEERSIKISYLEAKLGSSQSELVKNTMAAHIYKVDPEYGSCLAKAIGADEGTMEKTAKLVESALTCG